MGALFVFIGSGLLLFVAVLLRTILITSKQTQTEPAVDAAFDSKALSRHLLQAIRVQTISHQERAQYKGEEFTLLHDIFEMDFPLVHATLNKEVVWEYSLLYTWKGQDEKLKPILLLAHLDVVPAELFSEEGMEHPAFEGRIAEGYIWGKGTQDDKYAVLGILEAVEKLIQEGFTPRRTIYLAFGHDEEVGGQGGAFHIGALLHARGVELDFVMDEGLPIVENVLPNISKPVALVGVAEKKSSCIELTVNMTGGHSMMPLQNTAIGILSAAIDKLEKDRFPPRIEMPVRQMLKTLAPEMPFGGRVLFANLWLFEGLVKKKLAASPRTDALIRTTTVPTIFEAGAGNNILPTKARSVMNIRLLPGDNIKKVIKRVEWTIGDPRVKIKPLDGIMIENSFVSDTNSPGFKTIERTIRQVFPGVLVAPGLCLAITDSRYYTPLTPNIFRFSPIRLQPDNLQRFIHGGDEKISIESYMQAVMFYMQLIRNSDSMKEMGGASA